MEHRAVQPMLFLPNDEKASWSLLLSLVSAKHPENTYLCIWSKKAKTH